MKRADGDGCADTLDRFNGLRYTKVFTPQETSVALVLHNVTAKPLANIVVLFDSPTNLRATYACSDAAAPVSGSRVTIPALASHAGVHILVQYGINTLPAPGYDMVLLGKASYQNQEAGTHPSLSFSLTLTAGDLLRLVQTNTQEFGGRWGAHQCEAKVRIGTGKVHTPHQFNEALAGFNFFPVQIINTEAIAAARLMGADRLVLSHARVAAGTIELTIRSNDSALSQCVAAALHKALV